MNPEIKRKLFPIEKVEVSAYKIPTSLPESDGTLEWNSTTLVVVELVAGSQKSFGYTYADTSTACLVRDLLSDLVLGRDAMDVASIWNSMVSAVRNLGQTGIAAMAIAAVDASLWDLKGRLLGLPLVRLLGSVRESIPIYGSGGFTSYTPEQLKAQMSAWVRDGIKRVKMKVGRNPEKDIERVQAVRKEIGPDTELFVDANGAYNPKQALLFAEAFSDYNVIWFEEPVPSDDLRGLKFIRHRAPEGMDITAGEYGYNLAYFQHMLDAEAVDVLQADATRCQGITGFLQVASLCEARFIQLSSHTAPSLHLQLCCALLSVRHLEYFHDHVKIEQMFFDGFPKLENGNLYPDLTRPGLGIDFKKSDAAPFAL